MSVRTQKNKKNFFNSKFLIVGTVRNCEKIIKKQIKIINDAFINTALTKWLIVESDSDDNTLKVLKTLSHELNLKYVSLGSLYNKFPNRIHRLSVCRNYYLNEINNNIEYDNIDYVVIADLDGVNLELNQSALQTCWSQTVDWDVLFANQSAPYYDIKALRHKIWSPNDCSANVKFLKNHGVDLYSAEATAVWSRMIKINITHEPIEVDSAFGGLGIYKKKVLKGCNYDGGLDKNESEHIFLNKQIKDRGYKLYILPSLINGGWNEHNSNLRFHNRIKKKLSYYFINFLSIFFSEMKLRKYLNTIRKFINK